jgi:hypothetical protein
MKQKRLICAVMGWILACSFTSMAQEKGVWRAASTTAQSITGDVAFSSDKISINFASFTIAQIRALEASEVHAVFDSEDATGGSGNLYRLEIPGTKKFVHHNTLCGSEDTEWVATYVSGRNLLLAFFSGEKMPVFTPDAIANSTHLCGTYLYVR